MNKEFQLLKCAASRGANRLRFSAFRDFAADGGACLLASLSEIFAGADQWLRHRRTQFDAVTRLSREGVNKAAVSRGKGMGWGTVYPWLDRAEGIWLRFRERKLEGAEPREIQGDQIRMFGRGKGELFWQFGGIEGGTRRWPATVVGRRGFRNTLNLVFVLFLVNLFPVSSEGQSYFNPLAEDSDGFFSFPIQYNANGDTHEFSFGLIKPYVGQDSMTSLFSSGWFGLSFTRRDTLYHYRFRKNVFVKVITDIVTSRESTRKRWDEQLGELLGFASAEYSQARTFLTTAQATGDVAQFLSESRVHQFKKLNFQAALRNSMERLKRIKGKTPILDKVDSAMDALSGVLLVNDIVLTIAYYEAFATELALERLAFLESQELFALTLSDRRDEAWDAAIAEVRANLQALGQGDSMRSFILAFEDNLPAIIENGLNVGYKIATRKLALAHPGWAAVPAAWSYFFTESADYVDALHYATIATTLYRMLGVHEPEITELKYATQILAYDYILEVAENSEWSNWFQLLIFRPSDGSSRTQLQSRYDSGRRRAVLDARASAASFAPVQVPAPVFSLSSTGPYLAFNGESFTIEGDLSLDGNPLPDTPVQIQLGNLTIGTATTGANGSYSFQGYAPNSSGTHAIRISATYANLETTVETSVTTNRNVEGYDIELRLIGGSGSRSSGGTSNVEFSVSNAGEFSTDVSLDYQVFGPSGQRMIGNAPGAETINNFSAAQTQSRRPNFTVGNATGLWRIVVTANSSQGDEYPANNTVTWGVFVGDVEDADGYTGGKVWVEFVGTAPWNLNLGSGYTLEIDRVSPGRNFQADLKRNGATVDSNERFNLRDLYLRDDILIYVSGMSNIGTPMAGIEYGIAGSAARATPAKRTVIRGERADFLIDANFNISNMDVLRGWRQGDTIDDQSWRRDRDSGNLVFELQTSGLVPGNYEWFVSADDGSGRTVFQRLELTVLEPHDVALALTSPSSASSGDAVALSVGLTGAGAYTEVSDVSLTVTGPDSYSRTLISRLVTFQGSTSLPATWETQGLTGGTYRITAAVTTAGDSNSGNNTATKTFTLASPPELAILLPQPPNSSTEGTFTEVAFQVSNGEVPIDGAAVAGKLTTPDAFKVSFTAVGRGNGSYTTSLALNGPGKYEIEATSTLAGYIAATLAPVAFSVVDLPPESSIAPGFPAEGQWVNTSSIVLTGMGSDAVFSDDGLLFSWQADYPNVSWTAPSRGESRFTVSSLGEGDFAVALRVSQLDGLVDPTPAIRNFKVDLTPPTLDSPTFDGIKVIDRNTIEVVGTASDALSGLDVVTASNGARNLGTPAGWRFNLLPEELPVTVRVFDIAGNETARVIEASQGNAAPVLLPIGNRTVDELTVLTFTASATDPDLPPQTLTYSLIGEPSGASIDSSTGMFSWSPTEEQGPGSYTFTVQVSDGRLMDSEEITVTVNERSRDNNFLPRANAGPDLVTTDTNGDGRATVTLDGSTSTDPEGSLANYAWNWDDNGLKTANGVTAQASFPVGSTIVTLTVSDDEGATAADTFTVTVEPFAQPTYTITANSSGSGTVSVSPNQVQFDAGTSVILTAMPEVGFAFTRWMGDVPAGSEQENPLTLTVDRDRTIIAQFDVINSQLPPVTTLLSEDWEAGLDAEKWALWGSPAPVLFGGGTVRGSWSLKNNGDGSWESGVVAREPLSLVPGLRVAMSMFVEKSTAWSSSAFGLTTATPGSFGNRSGVSGLGHLGIGMGVVGDQADGMSVGASGSLVPAVDSTPYLGTWQEFAFELNADGSATYFLNGEVFGSTEPGRVDYAANAQAYLVIGGRSAFSDNLVDDITVIVPVEDCCPSVDLPPVTTLLSEDWEAGLDEGKWALWGSPAPVLFGGGTVRGSWSLKNNGDGSWESGVVAREPLSLVPGLRVAMSMFVEKSTAWSSSAFGLTTATPGSFGNRSGVSGLGHLGIGMGVVGDQADGMSVGASGSLVPAVDSTPYLGTWQEFALELNADGSATYFLNGEVFGSTEPGRVDYAANAQAYLVIGGRSAFSDNLVDDITVTVPVEDCCPPEATLEWEPTIPSMVYGSPLGGDQLNATASVVGEFVYEPPAGTVLPAGSQRVNVRFTPRDADVNGIRESTATIVLDVIKAPLVITANSINRGYLEPNPMFTASVDGLVNGDGPSSIETPITFTTDGIAGASAGSYPLIPAGGTASNYSIRFVAGMINISKADATITLGNLEQTADGTPRVVTVTTNPNGIDVDLTYNGRAEPPTEPGTYGIRAIVDDPNFKGFELGTLVVRGIGSIDISNLTQTYTGEALSPTIVTIPEGLRTLVTYNGSPELPVDAGRYEVRAVVDDASFTAFGIDVFEIQQADAEVILDQESMEQPINALIGVSFRTVPVGLEVDIYYDGARALPIAVGSYTVRAVINDPNWRGEATDVLHVGRYTQTITTPILPVFPISGSPVQIGLFASASSGLPVSFRVLSGAATVNGSILTVTQPGVIEVQAVQAGDDIFASASADFWFRVSGQGVALEITDVEIRDGEIELIVVGEPGASVNILGAESLAGGGGFREVWSIKLDSNGNGSVRLPVSSESAFFKAVDSRP